MKKLAHFLIATAILFNAAPLFAQQQKKAASTGGVSPHETTSTVIDGCRVTITYGRPFTKDPKTGEARKIWGGLVPWDKAWRTGSDEDGKLGSTSGVSSERELFRSLRVEKD